MDSTIGRFAAHIPPANAVDLRSPARRQFSFLGDFAMRLLIAALVVSGLAGLTAAAHAADANPTGTWKWTMTVGKDKTPRDVTLKLKLEGDKLTGSISGRNNQDIAIENGSFKDGTVSFTVTREFNDQKFTTKYSGKLDGDTIKGTQDTERGGKTNSREWEAKRSK
jgi:hypothetical protein